MSTSIKLTLTEEQFNRSNIANFFRKRLRPPKVAAKLIFVTY